MTPDRPAFRAVRMATTVRVERPTERDRLLRTARSAGKVVRHIESALAAVLREEQLLQRRFAAHETGDVCGSQNLQQRFHRSSNLAPDDRSLCLHHGHPGD